MFNEMLSMSGSGSSGHTEIICGYYGDGGKIPTNTDYVSESISGKQVTYTFLKNCSGLISVAEDSGDSLVSNTLTSCIKRTGKCTYASKLWDFEAKAGETVTLGGYATLSDAGNQWNSFWIVTTVED
jgi:hypothetical protein